MADTPSASGLASLIPHVWFDIIGRIVPGAYLLAGLFELFSSRRSADLLSDYLKLFPFAGPPLGLLILTGLTYLVGFSLGIGSYWIVGRFLFGCSAVSLDEVDPIVKGVLCARYGPNWHNGGDEQAVRKAMDYCSYFVWHRSPGLAVMFSRWDAEALAFQSLVLASIVLICVCSLTRAWDLIAFFLVVGFLAALGFRYYRRRATLSRFDMFVMLTRM